MICCGRLAECRHDPGEMAFLCSSFLVLSAGAFPCTALENLKGNWNSCFVKTVGVVFLMCSFTSFFFFIFFGCFCRLSSFPFLNIPPLIQCNFLQYNVSYLVFE